MMRRRIRSSCGALLLALAASGDAGAHNDDAGPLLLYASFHQMGSSSGYFDFELRWDLKGSKDGISHNKWVDAFWRIESAPTNLGTWSLFQNIKGLHVSNVGPVPTHRWYRFRGGGGFCYGLRCLRNVTFAPMWRPAEACGGGRGGGGRRGPW